MGHVSQLRTLAGGSRNSLRGKAKADSPVRVAWTCVGTEKGGAPLEEIQLREGRGKAGLPNTWATRGTQALWWELQMLEAEEGAPSLSLRTAGGRGHWGGAGWTEVEVPSTSRPEWHSWAWGVYQLSAPFRMMYNHRCEWTIHQMDEQTQHSQHSSCVRKSQEEGAQGSTASEVVTLGVIQVFILETGPQSAAS